MIRCGGPGCLASPKRKVILFHRSQRHGAERSSIPYPKSERQWRECLQASLPLQHILARGSRRRWGLRPWTHPLQPR
eukprot:6475805-Amphidinium_carterae.3